MFDSISAQQMFFNTELGLQRVYQLLTKNGTSSIKKSDLANPDGLSQSDLPFAQFLNYQFSSVDKNMNNEISKDEIEQMVKGIKQSGFNYEQLMFLAGQTEIINSGKTKDILDEVIENFKEVDSNRDGKVSSDEIKAYFVNKEIDDKKEELTAFKESDITTFYVTDNTSNKSNNDDITAIASEGL